MLGVDVIRSTAAFSNPRTIKAWGCPLRKNQFFDNTPTQIHEVSEDNLQ
jgi:hypothetical protein